MQNARFTQAIALLVLAATTWSAAADTAGEVTRLQGGAFAINGEQSRNLTKGMPIEEGDRILTGRGARVGLQMIDGAQITLGDLTDFKVERYQYVTDKSGDAALGLARGVFRAITGALGKLPNRPFRVTTPLATIGIRGTDFWGEQSAQRFEIALLAAGGVFIENRYGRVAIDNVGDGVTVLPGKAPSAPRPWSDAKLAKAKQTVE